MASVNKVILVGNLGQEPETRYMPDGTQVCRLSLATTDKYKDKNDEKQERTEWHRLVMYRKLAEIAAEYLHKGSQIYIEGKLRTQIWTDKQDIERYTTEIIVYTLQMLGKKDASSGQGRPSNASNNAPTADNAFDDFPDIPF